MSGRPLAYAPDQVKNILPGEASAPGGARTHGLPAGVALLPLGKVAPQKLTASGSPRYRPQGIDPLNGGPPPPPPTLAHPPPPPFGYLDI